MQRAPLADGHGRQIHDVRISVTDRCNFRCQYCMPAEGLPWLDRDAVLRFEEIERLVGLLAQMGVGDLRLTGGEPLVRRDFPTLVGMLAPLVDDLAITTNGFLLARDAAALVAAGAKRFNVSIDSLQRDRFFEMTRRDALDKVLHGLETLAQFPEAHPIKVNAVAMRGFTEDEAIPFARFAREHPYEVRFIEFMPLDAPGDWRPDQVVPAHEILERIDAVFPLEQLPVAGAKHSEHIEPAERFRYADGIGDVGVIASVTEPFCEQCDRIRMTAEGKLRTCLFALEEFDLRAILRRDDLHHGTADDELDDRLADEIIRAVGTKWAGHRIGQVDFVRPDRSMSQIGG
jgi:cyclic pyranopterin phosphate synthase